MKYLKTFEGIEPIKLIEDYLSKMINWDMIKDIKDMALEYLDDGYELGIHIKNYTLDDVFHRMIYTIEYSHDRYDEDWVDLHGLFYIGDNIEYRIFLMIDKGWPSKIKYDKDMSLELISRIKEAYPNEIILA